MQAPLKCPNLMKFGGPTSKVCRCCSGRPHDENGPNVCLKPWRTDVMGFGGSDVWAVSFPCQVWQCFCKGEWWSQSCIRKLYVEALYTDLEISPSLLNDWVTEVVFKKWLWNRNFCDMIACTSCGNYSLFPQWYCFSLLGQGDGSWNANNASWT